MAILAIFLSVRLFACHMVAYITHVQINAERYHHADILHVPLLSPCFMFYTQTIVPKFGWSRP